MNDFYGIIKLIDGTEIIGNIVCCEEHEGFIIENPFSLSTSLITTPIGEMIKVDLKPWINFVQEEIFFIEKSKIFTVGECEHKILNLYRSTLNKYLNKPNDNKVSLDQELGFKTKINKARILLENLYNLKDN
jgi:hypothetical protein